MARNRVIYQTEGLYAGGTGNGAATTQIKRVQSANYSFDITRQDINQYGSLARIDSVILDPPTVSLDFSYYLTDGANEAAMGFTVSGQGAGGVNSGASTAFVASQCCGKVKQEGSERISVGPLSD